MTRSMLSCAVLVGAALVVSPACADPDKENFHARLSGFNDVGALNAETGAILSDGTATADVEFDKQLGHSDLYAHFFRP